jgi:hypothetical protein
MPCTGERAECIDRSLHLKRALTVRRKAGMRGERIIKGIKKGL